MAGDPLETVVIVPARMGATRLPGKPLADIGGMPMVVRVLSGLARSGGWAPVVATDAEAVAEAARAAGFRAVMTGPARSGTDRVHAAWAAMGRPGSRIVNIQGDEPMADSSWLEALTSVETGPARVSTLARPCGSERAAEPSSVKVVTDARGRALYFSRSHIPHGSPSCLEHLGAYCFSPESLEAAVRCPASPASESERLEQLAWMHQGMELVVVTGGFQGFGIDTPADLERIRALV